jgi:hypothetical protein
MRSSGLFGMQRFEYGAVDLLDALPAAPDNLSRARRIDDDAHDVRRALNLDARDARAVPTLLDDAPYQVVLVQRVGGTAFSARTSDSPSRA